MTDDVLTDRQRQLLTYVLRVADTTGTPPSGPQIARHFDFRSDNAAYDHLRALERKGFVRRNENGWHRYVPTERARRLTPQGLPLLGSIPAGPTWYAEDLEAEWVSGVDDLFPAVQVGDFLLTVSGDSMIGAGLNDGMFVHMRPRITPRSGDICAVWVEGDGGTLKRVVPDGEFVRLIPENPAYEERVVNAENVIIQGVLLSAASITHYRN